jgi:hypothetical protein
LFGFGILAGLLKLVLIVLLAMALYGCMSAMRRTSPLRANRYLTYRSRGYRSFWLRILFLPKPDQASYLEKERLLRGCGWNIAAGRYMILLRTIVFVFGIVLLLLLVQGRYAHGLLNASERLLLLVLSTVGLAAAMADTWLLEKLQHLRRYRVMRDIDVLSRQLLYYSGLSGNIHGKLMRCLPFAGSIRSQWYQLTSEWYHSADLALQRFAQRVATAEAISFADTLGVLRQYDNDRYYELLRERIADYKEKLELFKESRKESLSYVLFIISGIPILYTFRVFVYPWVAEGQKLFESLG